ncbi:MULTISPECIES: sensor histidine kinase [unclassified Streptomyces]|uniref:sensor histidine kinase n=1 Tax=Streptomycetaceae TaxID=2062 RepID=UPI002E7A0D0F|nr:MULTISPECIES: sensor histidine kinase [unclassified Streptomyces]MED7950771.1 sensor histidine kinase [Streptomyces sp. BE303]MEE1821025.1 sensor histidine kinase [Streptomyces sp. BE20]
MATERPRTTPVARMLQVCLHLSVAGLLALAVARAAVGRGGDLAAVTSAATAMAAVYAAGPLIGAVRRSRRASVLWLALLGVTWAGVLVATPDGVWVAFPLYFLELHLLGRRAGPAAVLLTAVAAITAYSAHEHTVSVAAAIGPLLGAAVAVATVLGYQALYRESEERRRLIDELTAARADLAAAHHAAGVLAERERLAREIHDTLAQSLTSIQLLLRAAQRALPERTGAVAEYVEQARQAAQDNLAEARRFVRALTPPDLESGSLPDALERLCATTSVRSGLPVRLHVSGERVRLPVPHEVALLRIAQSALGNTVRHAGATHAEMTLGFTPGEVALDVVDDGAGFDPEALAEAGPGDGDRGFGLPSMRARARSLGGTFAVESAPGEGTALAVLLPVPAATPEESA